MIAPKRGSTQQKSIHDYIKILFLLLLLAEHQAVLLRVVIVHSVVLAHCKSCRILSSIYSLFSPSTSPGTDME